MKRFLITAALLAAVATPLAAQQDQVRTPADTTVTTTAQVAIAPSTGPRVRAEFRPAEARLSQDRSALMYQGDNHTISVSTVVLVLLVVVLVLLVVR
jgi:hypothetical protein